MFILDAGNFRVQKWEHRKLFGTTVAGNGKNGTASDSVSYGYGLHVDENHNIYVSEYENHRVTLWLNNGTKNGRLVCIYQVRFVFFYLIVY